MRLRKHNMRLKIEHAAIQGRVLHVPLLLPWPDYAKAKDANI